MESIQHDEMHLPGKPSAALQYSFRLSNLPATMNTSPLVVFLNGLALPRSSWQPTMIILSQQCHDTGRTRPIVFSYDRYGQAQSDPDPKDKGKPDGHTHDLNDVVEDLAQILETFSREHLGGVQAPDLKSRSVVFVCNSIGCPIARLFAQKYPSIGSAFIFLDSMIANTDFVSMLPDPESSEFDRESLPVGVTKEDIGKARQGIRQVFHPSVPNKERLDRSITAQLLPHSDGPKLDGGKGWGPLLTVVGHDWDVFAAESKRNIGLPEALCNEYINPQWHRYNQGLARLTKKEQWSEGPIIAKGCGHFIQRDDPEFVATQVLNMLSRLDDIDESVPDAQACQQ